jgi:apolipoprotein N-acyltransferase
LKLTAIPGRWGDLTALAAGALMPLGFAPFNVFIIPVIALAVLFFLWREVTPWRAFWRGWLFGVGMGWGIAWVRISMMEFGGVAPVAAWALSFALIAYVALYPAVLAYWMVRIFPDCNRVRLLLVSPALWTLLEWVRSWLFSGFPWLSLGYSQIDAPLAGLAPFSGVYGVTWATAFSASLLVYAYMGGMRRALSHALPAFVGLWLVAWLMTQVNWSRPYGEPFNVALVQANIPQELKWDHHYADEIMMRYLTLSQEHLDARLIIWPETAVPMFLGDAPPGYEDARILMAELENLYLYHRIGFMLGIREYDATTQQYYNSIATVGHASGIYRKVHLVPFGEFVPLRAWLGDLMRILDLPLLEDFSRGERTQPLLEMCKQSIGASICYEDAFPTEIRRPMPFATLLVNVSNDAWFGDSIAPHQHLQIARMRALENGRWLLRATNTGISAVIDDKGKIITHSQQGEITVLRADIQPLEGGTPYALSGNFQLFFIMFFCLIIGFILHYHWHLPHFPPPPRPQ